MNNRSIFANNLNKYMRLKNVSRRDLSEALGYSYYTVTDWVNGKKYPRMDKVEQLANYFGIQKSDLIEETLTEDQAAFEASILLDEDIMELVHTYMVLSDDQKKAVKQMAKLLAST